MRARLNILPLEGELFRALVDSQRAEKGEPPYLCDMESFDFNGECPCENFQREQKPLVEAQLKQPISKRIPFRCVHLIDFAEYFLREQGYRMRKAIEGMNKGKVFGTRVPDNENESPKIESAEQFYQSPV